MSSPLLFALDIDGTVVDWDDQLSPRVAAAIKSARAAGHHVVLATGRSAPGTWRALQMLDLSTGWAVSSNGAVTMRLDPSLEPGFELRDVRTFDPAQALLLLREHLPGAIYFVEGADVMRTRLISGDFFAGEQAEEGIVQVPFEELLHVPATRVAVRSLVHTGAEFEALVAASGLHGVSYSVGWTAWLDLAPDGVSKASALEVVRGRLEVDADRTIAVGDGFNNLEMFDWAHRSFAMGQADPRVHAAADEATASVTEDGVAQVIEEAVAAG